MLLAWIFATGMLTSSEAAPLEPMTEGCEATLSTVAPCDVARFAAGAWPVLMEQRNLWGVNLRLPGGVSQLFSYIFGHAEPLESWTTLFHSQPLKSSDGFRALAYGSQTSLERICRRYRVLVALALERGLGRRNLPPYSARAAREVLHKLLPPALSPKLLYDPTADEARRVRAFYQEGVPALLRDQALRLQVTYHKRFGPLELARRLSLRLPPRKQIELMTEIEKLGIREEDGNNSLKTPLLYAASARILRMLELLRWSWNRSYPEQKISSLKEWADLEALLDAFVFSPFRWRSPERNLPLTEPLNESRWMALQQLLPSVLRARARRRGFDLEEDGGLRRLFASLPVQAPTGRIITVYRKVVLALPWAASDGRNLYHFHPPAWERIIRSLYLLSGVEPRPSSLPNFKESEEWQQLKDYLDRQPSRSRP